MGPIPFSRSRTFRKEGFEPTVALPSGSFDHPLATKTPQEGRSRADAGSGVIFSENARIATEDAPRPTDEEWSVMFAGVGHVRGSAPLIRCQNARMPPSPDPRRPSG